MLIFSQYGDFLILLDTLQRTYSTQLYNVMNLIGIMDGLFEM